MHGWAVLVNVRSGYHCLSSGSMGVFRSPYCWGGWFSGDAYFYFSLALIDYCLHARIGVQCRKLGGWRVVKRAFFFLRIPVTSDNNITVPLTLKGHELG